MAASLSLFTPVQDVLSLSGLIGLAYIGLLALFALVAVFSSKPHRRKAALEVLKILKPGRQLREGRRDRVIRNRTRSTDPQILRPPTDEASGDT